MGMAASQARLLTITARIHDIEYQAQTIQNAKVALATQQDQVYEDYQNALDATTLTFTAVNDDGTKSTLVANYVNLFSVNKAYAAGGADYALFDERNRVIVDQSLYEGYQDYMSSNCYKYAESFAMFMMGVDVEGFTGADLQGAENGLAGYYDDDEKLQDLNQKIEDITGVEGNIYDTSNIENDPEKMAEYKKALEKYLHYIYVTNKHNYAADIYHRLTGEDMEDFDQNEFNYYVKMYKVIEQSNGCVSIESFNGISGDAKTDSEWLTNMVQSGKLTIEVIKQDKHTGEVTLNGTSPSSDEALQYTTTTQIDKVALAKAEAKYEHDLKMLDRKDKKFDLDLSKLETERTALKTQYESVKKVIEDNIDRSFKIFS